MLYNTAQCPVTISNTALSEFKRLLAEKHPGEQHGLRLGVKGGGCAGFSYVLGIDTIKEDDEVFELNGLKVFMNKAHGLYLAGTHVDYQEGLHARGFTFSNPNAEKTCGCGSSFSA
jgi:iron-sulfur cluster assembly protein